MTLVVTANVVGQVRGEPVRLPARRRRLSTIVARHRPADGRRFLVSVHRRGADALQPSDRTVRLRAQWKGTLVGPEDVVLITVVPLGRGFASIGLAIASIALIALAPYAAPAIAAGLTGVATASAGATFAVQAGLVIGGLALGYAAQAAKGAGKTNKQAELYSLSGGGNVPRPGSRRPLLYGRCWSAPPLSQGDYFTYDGDTMVLVKRMTLGIGKFQVHRIRVGDALLWDETTGIQAPFSSTAAGNLGTAVEILYEQVSQIASGDVITSNAVSGQEMPRPGGNPARTPWFRLTPQGVVADAALLSWTYPAIYRVSSAGRQVGTVAGVVFYGRKIDPTTGAVLGPEFEIHRSTELSDTFSPTPLRRSAYFRLPEPGTTYEICAQNAYPDPVGFEQQNRATWDGMSAYRDDYRIRPETTEVVLRIRAGKGLTVTAYSDVMVDATRIVPVWNGSAWTEQANRKAVWAYCDLVRSTYGLAQPSGVDTAKALYYANLLTAQDTYDGPLPEVSSFWEAAGQILLPLRADPVKVGAVHSFVRDESRAEPRHVLTRRQIVRDSSGATYKTKVEGGDVIVEFDRDGDPKRPDEVRYSYGAPTRTPKRYKVAGITDGLHALKHATWLAAVAVFRGAERKVQTEWDGRLVFPGDHILSDLWFLRGKSVYGVASAAGNVLTLDVTANVPAAYGYGSIRTRQGREWGILRMRGVGARGLELHPDDVVALAAKTGLNLAAVLARDTQDPTTVVLGELVELQETYVARSAVPSDPDHVQIEMVANDARVWQLLDETVIAPVPVNADSLTEPLIPQISVLHARCMRIETGIEVVWGVSVTAGARNYEADISYDGGGAWEVLSALGPASSGRAQMRQTDRPVTVRARAYGRTGLHGDWITTTFTTVAPIVAGALVDVTTLPPITYDNLDAVIQDRIDSIESIKDRAEEAYTDALDALDRADDARSAADAARASATTAIANAGTALSSAAAAQTDATKALANAQTAYQTAVDRAAAVQVSAAAAQADATKALADAQTAFQAAVDRSAAALSGALARIDQLRRGLAVDPIVRQGYIDPLVADVRSDLEILMRNATRNMQDIAGLRDALTTAGLEIIPGEGRVRFYAIEALQTAVGRTISNFSITIDALSQKIDLYGSAQGEDLQGLIASINTVQTTLDAQAATIGSLATSAQFTSLGARLASAEQTISAQDAAIAARATTATVNAQGVRLTSAEQRISASEGRINQQVLATQSAGIDADLLPRTLGAFLELAQRQQGALSQSLALSTQAMSANVDQAGRATAELRTELLVYKGDAAAQFLTITRAVADTNTALVTATTQLTARVTAADAAITAEATARVAADAATTTRLDTAVSRIGAAEAGLVMEQQTRAAADAAATLRIDTAVSRVTAAEGRIGTAEAAITEERRTRAEADVAQTSRITAAVSRVAAAEGRIGAAEAGLVTEAETRADADSAQTTRIDGAVSRVTAAEEKVVAAEANIASEARTRAAADAATTTRVDGAVSRITATEGRIGGVEGRITTAEASLVTEQRTRADADAATTLRVDGAVSRITAAEGRLGTAEASLTTEAKTRADADTAATSRIDTAVSRVAAAEGRIGGVESRIGTAEASLTTEAKTRADADGAATLRIDGAVSRITAVEGRAGAAEASIATEAKTRADADTASTSRVDAAVSRITAAEGRVGGVEGRIGTAEASLATEAKTRADADTAQTTATSLAVSRITGAEGRIGGVEGRVGIAEASLVTEAKTRADADTVLTSNLNAAISRIGTTEASIATEAKTRADADVATTSRIDGAASRITAAEGRLGGVEGRIGTAEASLVTEAKTRADADTATTSRVDGAVSRITMAEGRIGGVEGRIGTAEASLVTEAKTRADADAAATLRVDGAISRINTAEGRIGAAEANLTTEAKTRADADGAATSRINAAVSRIEGAEGRIGGVEASLVTEAKTRADADTASTSRIDGAISRISGVEGRMGTAEASLATEAKTRADADAATTSRVDGAVSRITANEGQIGGLDGRIGTAEAAIVTEAKTRADQDAVQASSISALSGRMGSAETAINTVNELRNSGDVALASRIDLITTRVGTAEANLVTEAKTRADADTASTSRVDAAISRIATAEGRIGTAEATIASEAKTRADQDGVIAMSVSGLSGRMGAAEVAINTVNELRSSGDVALASRIDVITTRVGTAEATIASEAKTRADQDAVQASSISGLSGRMGSAETAINTVNELRSSGDAALASQVTDLYARSDIGTAYGRFAMQVQSAPSGVSVRLAAVASTESYGTRRNAGWYLDLLPDGSSRFVIDANFFAITANGGVSYPFQFDGSTLTIPNLRVTSNAFLPNAVSTGRYKYDPNSGSTSIQITTRPNSKVLILARFDGAPGSGRQPGTVGVLTIARDGTPFDQTFIPFYVAGNNNNTFQFPLAAVSFWVDENPGAGLHTYTCYVDNGLPGVRLVVFELAA